MFRPLAFVCAAIAAAVSLPHHASADQSKQCVLISEIRLLKASGNSENTALAESNTASGGEADAGSATSGKADTKSGRQTSVRCEQISQSWKTQLPPQTVRYKNRAYTMLFCEDPFANQRSSQTGQQQRTPTEPTVMGEIAGKDDGQSSGTDTNRPTGQNGNWGSSSRKERVPVDPTVTGEIATLNCTYDRSCRGYKVTFGEKPIEGGTFQVNGTPLSIEDGCVRLSD